MTTEQLDALAKEAQAAANTIKVTDAEDGRLEAYRALLVVREAAKNAAKALRRIAPPVPNKKLCYGCGDNHAPFACNP